MRGPVSIADASADRPGFGHPEQHCLEVSESRDDTACTIRVRRALPHRGRRTVGARCSADHMGSAHVTENRGPDVGPHPHIGPQTVTCLTGGQVLHHDGLGSEQVVKPGQLNLTTSSRECGTRPAPSSAVPLRRDFEYALALLAICASPSSMPAPAA
ncbi:pirin family protein [Streptomyces rishiriensis]